VQGTAKYLWSLFKLAAIFVRNALGVSRVAFLRSVFERRFKLKADGPRNVEGTNNKVARLTKARREFVYVREALRLAARSSLLSPIQKRSIDLQSAN